MDRTDHFGCQQKIAKIWKNVTKKRILRNMDFRVFCKKEYIHRRQVLLFLEVCVYMYVYIDIDIDIDIDILQYS